jgi:type II secretory pathway component GspD/PulD (secretin)
MKLNSNATGRRCFSSTELLVAFTIILAFFASSAGAQAQSADSKPCSAKPGPDAEVYRSFKLNNVTQQSELSDISTAIRNIVSNAKIYSVATQNVITVRASVEDMELVQKMVAELDRPRKLYRLTYTITDIDGSKRADAQSYSLIVASDEKTSLKQGSRVPIVSATNDASNSSAESRVQYQDIGMHIEASVWGSTDGVMLRTKVEQTQTTIADEKATASPQNPNVLQAVWEGVSTLIPGKPLVIGSLGPAGTGHKQEVAVIAELVK